MADMHPQTAIDMGKLLQRLAGHPKTRNTILKAVKEVDPSYRLPADVAVADLEQRLRAEREKEKQDNWRQRRISTMAQQRKKLLENYSEEQLKEMETGIMKKYPGLDYNDAVKLYAADTTPVTPTTARERANAFKPGQYWEFPSIPGLLENPDRAATDMAYAVIDEMRGHR